MTAFGRAALAAIFSVTLAGCSGGATPAATPAAPAAATQTTGSAAKPAAAAAPAAPTDAPASTALIVGALEPKPFSGLAGSIMAIRFSPDGKTLAAGGQDPFVQLWDVASGKALKTLKSKEDPRATSICAPSHSARMAPGSPRTGRHWSSGMSPPANRCSRSGSSIRPTPAVDQPPLPSVRTARAWPSGMRSASSSWMRDRRPTQGPGRHQGLPRYTRDDGHAQRRIQSGRGDARQRGSGECRHPLDTGLGAEGRDPDRQCDPDQQRGVQRGWEIRGWRRRARHHRLGAARGHIAENAGPPEHRTR